MYLFPTLPSIPQHSKISWCLIPSNYWGQWSENQFYIKGSYGLTGVIPQRNLHGKRSPVDIQALTQMIDLLSHKCQENMWYWVFSEIVSKVESWENLAAEITKKAGLNLWTFQRRA